MFVWVSDQLFDYLYQFQFEERVSVSRELEQSFSVDAVSRELGQSSSVEAVSRELGQSFSVEAN